VILPPQHDQLLPERSILRLKPALRLEECGLALFLEHLGPILDQQIKGLLRREAISARPSAKA